MNFTEKILGCHPLPGNNKDLEKILTEEFAEYNCDVNTDALGNIFFTTKFGEGKNIMLCTSSDVPGVVAVYADKSRIYVGELGGVNIQRLANCKVVFDGASGIFTVPSSTASIGDCYVETYDEKAQEKVNSKVCVKCGKLVCFDNNKIIKIISETKKEGMKKIYVGENLHRYVMKGHRYLNLGIKGINYKDET